MSLSKQLVSAPAPAPAKFLYSSDLTLIAIVISSVTDVVKLLSYKQLSLPRVCQLVQQLIKNHNKVPIGLFDLAVKARYLSNGKNQASRLGSSDYMQEIS